MAGVQEKDHKTPGFTALNKSSIDPGVLIAPRTIHECVLSHNFPPTAICIYAAGSNNSDGIAGWLADQDTRLSRRTAHLIATLETQRHYLDGWVRIGINPCSLHRRSRAQSTNRLGTKQ